MPLDGNQVASKPAGTTAIPNTVVASAPYNAVIDDIYAIFNSRVQPLAQGGTGASTAIGAYDAFNTKGADVATAATLNLDAVTGAFVDLTGTTTVTAVTLASGKSRFTRAAAAFQITVGASLIGNNGGANVAVEAGDLIIWEGYAGGVVRFWLTRASGQAISSTNPPPKGHVFGLTLSTNATDATNDIDIAVGEASSDGTTPVLMILATALVKRLDASWSVGTNQGMLDTGAVANSTYYLWLIQRSDTGVADVLASLSATAPTMPTNYDRKRLIGRISRAAATNDVPVMYAQPLTELPGIAPIFGCRAWVSFNGITGAIIAQGNVSSITKNGTGDYTVNFTIPMPDTKYAMGGMGQIDAAGGIAYSLVGIFRGAGAKTVSSVRIGSASVSPAALDYSMVDVQVFR